jgi:uncharacterized membrane protein YbhN (UPF0104 family)
MPSAMPATRNAVEGLPNWRKAATPVAMVAGAASQAPGGLGGCDSAYLLLLPAGTPAPPIVAALLAFRATYYGVPLMVAAVLLVLREGRRRLLARSAGKAP